MSMTITEKIFARAAGREKVSAGDFLWARADLLILYELLFPYSVGKLFEETGAKRVWDPGRIVATIDHCVPAQSRAWAETHKRLREFVNKQGIKHFYDVGRHGISCQIAVENGHVLPGMLCIAADSTVITAGALGAVATGVASEEYVILALGEHWFRVPESLKFQVSGKFQKGVMARDLSQRVLADLGQDGAGYKAMEFTGPAIEAMSIAERMALCHMAQYTGAKNVIINPDVVTAEYVKEITGKDIEMVTSDPDATYEKVFNYDVSGLEPTVAPPPSVNNAASVTSVAGARINQAFVGSCASGRIEDLRVAARILKGQKVAPGVRMFIGPATQAIYRQAEKEGLIQTFAEAGAVITAPGCSVCIGNTGLLAAGEVCIASATANYPGRMGSKQAEIYLASPATVAASAVAGEIADPRKFL